MSPSRIHSSLTGTSLRNPSITMRIYSSDVCLGLVAAFTLRTKDLASSVRSSAATAVVASVWDIFALTLQLVVGDSRDSRSTCIQAPRRRA